MLSKNRALPWIMVLILSFSFTPRIFAAQPAFQDLEQHPYREEIELITDLGFIFYYEKPFYAPDMIVTRNVAAEAMYILSNATLAEIEGIDYSLYIPDVRDFDFPVYYCVGEGIAESFEDGSFRPNSPVTYGDFIKMLVTVMKPTESRGLSTQKDFLSFAGKSGITKGLTHGSDFHEDDLLTNDSAALFIYNSLHLPLLGEGSKTLLETTFKDLSEAAQNLNLIIAEVEASFNDAQDSGSVPDASELAGKLYEIEEYYSYIYDKNINAAYKYNLKINKLSEIASLLEQITALEEEISNLTQGTAIYGDYYQYESEALQEEETTSLGTAPEYEALFKVLQTKVNELTRQKLDLIKDALPGEEDLQKGIADMESWMQELLYEEPSESSATGIVLESAYDFMQLVENTYLELQNIYSGLFSEAVISDKQYEGRIDELYFIITGSIYMDVLEEQVKAGWNEAPEASDVAEYIIETLQTVEFVHYPEEALQLVDKLTEEYLKE